MVVGVNFVEGWNMYHSDTCTHTLYGISIREKAPSWIIFPRLEASFDWIGRRRTLSIASYISYHPCGIRATGFTGVRSSLWHKIPYHRTVVVTILMQICRSWFTWRDIFHVVDIICCCAIIFPIVWSINHLRKASQVRVVCHKHHSSPFVDQAWGEKDAWQETLKTLNFRSRL